MNDEHGGPAKVEWTPEQAAGEATGEAPDEFAGDEDATAAEAEWPSAPDARPGAWQLLEPLGRLAGRPRAASPAPGVAYAEFGLRAAAFAIDFAIYSVVLQFVAARISGGLQDILTDHGANTGGDIVVAYVAALGGITGLALLVLFGYCLTVLRATPGQLALGLATLRRRDGAALGFVEAFVRTVFLFGPLVVLVFYPTQAGVFDAGSLAQRLGDALPAVVLLWYVALSLAAFGDRRGQSVHDHLAGTVVIREVEAG